MTKLSYNTKWWFEDQENNGEANWIKLSKNKPWYKCITKRKVLQDPYAAVYYQDHGTPEEMLQCITGYYQELNYRVVTKRSMRTGYLIYDCFAVLPYIGQWGRGWILAIPRAGSTVTAIYILVDPLIEGGNRNAIADKYK